MKERDINERLLKHAIDHPGEPLPPDLADFVEKNEKAKQEWEKQRSWVNVLKDEDQWQAPDGFYEKLADRAFYEKRRADITASTKRDLHLDDDEQVWRPTISPWFARTVLVGLFFIMIGLPVAMMLFNQWNTIGQFDYVDGHVLAQSNGDEEIDYKDPIRRGATVITPANSNCILKLEGGNSIIVSALSRVNVDDARNIMVERGRVFFDITPGQGDFSVRVPDGSVHVIGTEFEVQVKEDSTSVLVTEGTVLLHDGIDEKPVHAGNLGEFLPSQPISVKTVPNAQLKLNWVNSIREKKNEHDIQRYYPSLARPTHLTGE